MADRFAPTTARLRADGKSLSSVDRTMAVKRYGKRLEQDRAERKPAAHAAQKLFVML
jgi:hypothetical protein